jgi:hypothetical protein
MKVVKKLMPPLDGVYYTDRRDEDFKPKIESLISKIIKRSEDLINLRGFVLDNSSDFELRIKSLLELLWQKLKDNHSDRLNEIMKFEIDSIERRNIKTLEKARDCSPIFPKTLQIQYLLSNADHLKILTRAIGILKADYHLSNDYDSFEDLYKERISHYRNALGHRTASEKTINVCGITEAIDEKLHRKMRENIQKTEKLLSNLESIIQEI